MIARPPVIDSLEEATPAWITSSLHDSGSLAADIAVTEVASQPVGTGQMGVSARLTLTYDRASPAPATLVVKLASPNPTVRGFMGPTGYAGEVGFYRDLAPQVSIRMPRAHAAARDPESGAFVLLLDDLAPAVQGDQLAGLTLEEAEVCMDELVRLHAPRWGDPTLAAEPALSHLVMGEAALQTVYQMVMPGFLDRFGPVLDTHGVELMELLTTGTDQWRTRGPSVRTLVHGDYRSDNLLIDRNVDPPTVAAVDWQGVRASAGQIDVAFLLATSVDPDVVEACESSLLRRWYDGLVAAGVAGYSWDSCREDYRWASIGTLQTTVLGAAFSEASERGEQMFVRMITGQVHQALRLGADELLR